MLIFPLFVPPKIFSWEDNGHMGGWGEQIMLNLVKLFVNPGVAHDTSAWGYLHGFLFGKSWGHVRNAPQFDRARLLPPPGAIDLCLTG